MKKKLRLLQVEDSEDDALLIRNELQRGGYEAVAERVETAQAMKAALKNHEWDIVISDYALPLFNGLDALEILKESGHDLPFILVSGMIGEDIAVTAMKAGAHDYIMKENLKRLAPAVSRELEEAENRRERKRAEEALRESEDRLRTMVNLSPDGITIIDSEGTIHFASPMMAHLLKIDNAEQLIGRSMFKMIVPEQIDHCAACFNGVLTESLKNVAVETLFLQSDGNKIPLEVKAGNFLWMGKPAVQLISRDITERKRSEESLQASEEKYRTLFEESKDAIFISTSEGKFVDINPAGWKLFGYSSKEELLNLDITDDMYVNPKDRAFNLRALAENGYVENYELHLKKNDGSVVIVLETATAVRDKQGVITGYRGILHDVTQPRLLEKELIQAQKLESLGTLAGGIAHDFNNILGIILGHSALLKRIQSDPAKFSQSIEAIQKTVQRGASLVKQLLTFAHKTEHLLESVSVNEVIKENTKPLLEIFPKTIVIETQLAGGLPSIIADTTQIHQVILNLCVNARDAMPRGGTLTIATAVADWDLVSSKHSNASGREYISISVADTGVGMDETTMARIFEPFFTTKDIGAGTGLGLSLVFSIVQNHGGFVDVASELGKGTTFSIYFPVKKAGIQDFQMVSKIVESTPGGTETILFIEDEEMLRDLVKAILVSKGYTVLTAQDGEEGIALYRRHAEKITVVVSDLGLPKVTGEEVFRQIITINPKAKIILASGFIDPNVKSELYKSGAKLFIQKPYQPEEVLQAIREVLDKEKR